MSFPECVCVHRWLWAFQSAYTSEYGRTTAESTARRLESAVKAVSTRPTPETRMLPPTTWRDKTASLPAGRPTHTSCAYACSDGLTRRPLGFVCHSAPFRRYNELLLATWVDDQPPIKTKSACAMVPLKPNELRRD